MHHLYPNVGTNGVCWRHRHWSHSPVHGDALLQVWHQCSQMVTPGAVGLTSRALHPCAPLHYRLWHGSTLCSINHPPNAARKCQPRCASCLAAPRCVASAEPAACRYLCQGKNIRTIPALCVSAGRNGGFDERMDAAHVLLPPPHPGSGVGAVSRKLQHPGGGRNGTVRMG